MSHQSPYKAARVAVTRAVTTILITAAKETSVLVSHHHPQKLPVKLLFRVRENRGELGVGRWSGQKDLQGFRSPSLVDLGAYNSQTSSLRDNLVLSTEMTM